MTVYLFCLVFVSATCLDFCAANYIMAVEGRSAWKASVWSTLQWFSSAVGFVVAIKVSLWALPAEVLGLATGSYLSVWRAGSKLKQ